MECFGPTGSDLPEDCRQGWVTQHVANIMGLSVRFIEIGGGDRVLFEMDFSFQQGVEPGADLKTTLCQDDGWLQ